MNKTFLIFKHEFSHQLKRKGFIIMTLIVPLLALLAIGILYFVSGAQKSPNEKVTNIGYIDEAGGFEQFTNQGDITLISFEKSNDATDALIKGNITEYFIIPSDYIKTGIIKEYTLQSQISVPGETLSAISNFLMSNMLVEKVPPTVSDRIKAPLNIINTTLTKNGTIAPDQGGLGNFIILGVFSLLFALSMVFSSTYMLQSLGGEKENRIMEILLSSVSARQLLIGKVLGIGTAGLVQVLVWAVSLPLLFKLGSSTIGNYMDMVQLPVSLLILGVVYFILGYFLFAVLSAGIGAISRTTQEGQQLASIYSLFVLAPLWLMSLIIAFPSSPVWVVFSIFPFSSPVLVMERLGMNSIASWEIVVSIVVLVLSIIGGLLLSAKVFKVYLLMYGKRPKLREVIHSFKNV